MPTEATALELDDIQSGALRPRPSPYVGVYFLLRIDDRRAGRELLRRLIPALADATNPADRSKQAWVTAALTYQGLKALGVPQDSLDSFPLAVPAGHGRARRRTGGCRRDGPRKLGKAVRDHGRPCRAERALARRRRGSRRPARARPATRNSLGSTAIWRLDCHALPTETRLFGFRDGISHPAIEGSGIPGSNPQEQPLKAGEFFLGYGMRRMKCPRCRGPRCWVKTAPTSFFASCTNAWRRFASI